MQGAHKGEPVVEPRKVLTGKAAWIMVITALPMVAYLIINEVIWSEGQKNFCKNGMGPIHRTSFIGSFAALCICLLGCLLAFKAFPIGDDSYLLAEFVGGIECSAEIYPE